MDNYDGYVKSFHVEKDGKGVVMIVGDPDGADLRVRVSMRQLNTMANAKVFYSDGPAQTPTPLEA